jgi:hypothetical protein
MTLMNQNHEGDCKLSRDSGCAACELEASESPRTQELPRSKEIQSQAGYPHGYYII